MTKASYDLVIRGGLLADAGGTMAGDIAVTGGRIAAIGDGLGPGAEEVDATGRLVLPGGVDTHCHIEQRSGAGLMNADTFETATRSALHGGTTTTVSFAAQHPGMDPEAVVTDYAARAIAGAMTDHAFHVIVSDIGGDAPAALARLIGQGHRSIKLFTTYDKVRLDDRAILEVMEVARANGALVCVHAENDGLIRFATDRLLAQGCTAPRDHAASHPRLAEIEALERLCRFAEYIGQPVMLFHVSTAEGVEVVRRARARRARVWAETCPHYLLQTEDALEGGAAFMCSPPQRGPADQEALWHGLANGDLALVSSDHAPYRLDETGKFAHGRDVPFPRIANGMPGLEVRLPLLFDAMVSRGRLGLARFVELTSAAPARIFGLASKGALRPGLDADLVLWDPEARVTLPDALHDNTGYNPFAGRTVTGWPACVYRRGRRVIEDGRLLAEPGSGRRLPMQISDAMCPR